MAIEFARCVVYSRSQGKNAVQAAAYRSASILFDDRTGMTFDYRDKPNVAHSEILLPAGADAAFADRQFLWNEVERVEIRRDAQVAKDYILALPKELTLEQNIALARQFAHDHFVSKGIPVDLNIHVEDGNIHAHLLTTTRRLVGKHFSLKARDLNPEFNQGIVVKKDPWGGKWRDAQDKFFKDNGIDLEVDPNHLIPTRHRGRPQNDDRAEYLDQDNQMRHEMEREIALNAPASLLNIMSERYSVFSDRDLACVVNKATNTPEEFELAILRVKAHPDLITLGPGDDGRLRYATRQYIKMEWTMEEQAVKLSKAEHHMVASWRLKEQIEKYDLNKGQQAALEHILMGGDIALVVGKAGTGKSYMMNAAREVWEAEGYRVIGVAVAGIASESLESGSNIKSSTIASFKYKLEKGKLTLGEKDVIVLDEAGMADSRDLSRIVDQVRAAGAKLILVGDPSQVQAVGPGAPFRALLERLGFAELTEIKRQRSLDDRLATTMLSMGKVGVALDNYAHKGQVFLSETEAANLDMLMSKWGQHITARGIGVMNETIILAHRNEDITILNQRARQQLIEAGILKGKAHAFEVKDNREGQKDKTKQIELMVGERILFLENSWKLNVKNGHFATITEIKGTQITAVIGEGKKARTVKFDGKEYQNFDYGYAATVHKNQGVTVDTSFLFVGGKYWSRNLIYVALTRHRDYAYIFADKVTHTNFETLKKNLSRLSIKDTVIDFPLNYAIRRGLDPDKVMGQCLNAMNLARGKIKDTWSFLADVEAYNEKLDRVKKDELKTTRRQDAVAVAVYADLKRGVGTGWSEMKRSAIPGKDFSEHAEYGKNYDLMIARNKQAHLLYNEAHKYELAMELNNVSLDELKRYSASHEARERVLRYEELAKKGHNLDAGKVAEEIRADGRLHGQFIRERGLSWDTINALGKRYATLTLLHSLDPVERNRHREVMEYQGKGRACVQAFKHKNPDPALALFATSDRNADVKALRVHLALSDLDKAAHHLFTHQAEYAKAIEQFKIPLDKLEREAKRHEHRQRVLAFLKAEKAGHILLKENIAFNIKKDLAANKKSYGSVIRELEFKGMEWKKIHLGAWAHDERRKPLLHPDQKAAVKAYAEYRAANRAIGRAVQRNKDLINVRTVPYTIALQAPSLLTPECLTLMRINLIQNEKKYAALKKADKVRRNKKYMVIKGAVSNRDAAAYRLWDEMIGLDERSLKKLDIARLKKESDTHTKREEVKAYAKAWQPQSLKTQLAAKKLLNNPDYEKLVKEQRLHFRIEPAVKNLDKRKALAALTPENRTFYKEAEHYRNLTAQSAKAWKRAYAATKSSQAISALAVNTNIAKAFAEQKSELAFKIYQNFEQYKPHLAALGIDEGKLQKTARDYGVKQTYVNKVHDLRSKIMGENIEAKKETYNADRIGEALINMGENFYQQVLGDIYSKPKHSGHNIRVGKKGSFSINVSGPHAGSWKSFESGEGGYPIQLLMNANYGYGLSYVDALEAGARIAGLSDSQAKDITYIRKQKSAEEIEAEARTLASEKQQRIENARYYFKTSQPIAGTIAERYLRETRHIEGDLSGFRFHPRVKDPQSKAYYPAALIAAKNEQGHITATQTILIDPATAKKVDKAEVDVPKRTRGVISGSVALIHKGESNKVIIAEGPETAASLIKAFPDANIYVTVGNIRNAEHLAWVAKKHSTDTFYFAADNDGENQRPTEALKKAAQKLESEGIKCYKATPNLRAVEKPDYNDVLIHQGVDGVKRQMSTMRRVLNESEKISFGLTPVKAQEIKPENKPVFWVSGDKISLSAPVLKQVEEYAALKELEKTKRHELNNLVMDKGNRAAIDEGHALIKTVKADQSVLLRDLAKHEKLWEQARSMTPAGAGGVKIDAVQIRRNSFEPKDLKQLHIEVHSAVQSHKASLNQNKSGGWSY
ncbi:MAG: Ti-type conjugative transfer relaxase TraA [Gammaproteobacteria bacterium]|nr:Ti-type conjugative transfer relaxase TraA [Gammaproteobacteria bacterium]